MWLKAEAEGFFFPVFGVVLWLAAESLEFFIKLHPFGSMVEETRAAFSDF
jgi:hypothetical protein